MSWHLNPAVNQAIAAKSLRDDDFRRRLKDNPRAIVERELSRVQGGPVRLPQQMNVRVIEEGMQEMIILLPHDVYSRPVVPAGLELTDQQLEQLAGATSSWGAHCTHGESGGDCEVIIVVNKGED